MNAAALPHFDAAESLPGGFIGIVRSLFARPDAAASALAASLASELRVQPELPRWVISLASLPRSQRAVSLLDEARNFRGEGATARHRRRAQAHRRQTRALPRRDARAARGLNLFP